METQNKKGSVTHEESQETQATSTLKTIFTEADCCYKFKEHYYLRLRRSWRTWRKDVEDIVSGNCSIEHIKALLYVSLSGLTFSKDLTVCGKLMTKTFNSNTIRLDLERLFEVYDCDSGNIGSYHWDESGDHPQKETFLQAFFMALATFKSIIYLNKPDTSEAHSSFLERLVKASAAFQCLQPIARSSMTSFLNKVVEDTSLTYMMTILDISLSHAHFKGWMLPVDTELKLSDISELRMSCIHTYLHDIETLCKLALICLKKSDLIQKCMRLMVVASTEEELNNLLSAFDDHLCSNSPVLYMTSLPLVDKQLCEMPALFVSLSTILGLNIDSKYMNTEINSTLYGNVINAIVILCYILEQRLPGESEADTFKKVSTDTGNKLNHLLRLYMFFRMQICPYPTSDELQYAKSKCSTPAMGTIGYHINTLPERANAQSIAKTFIDRFYFHATADKFVFENVCESFEAVLRRSQIMKDNDEEKPGGV